MEERKLKNTIQIFTVLGVFLLFVLGAILLVQSVQLKVANEKLTELKRILNATNIERTTLEEEAEYRKTEIYIEEYAREYLNMQKEGEIRFVPEG